MLKTIFMFLSFMLAASNLYSQVQYAPIITTNGIVTINDPNDYIFESGYVKISKFTSNVDCTIYISEKLSSFTLECDSFFINGNLKIIPLNKVSNYKINLYIGQSKIENLNVVANGIQGAKGSKGGKGRHGKNADCVNGSTAGGPGGRGGNGGPGSNGADIILLYQTGSEIKRLTIENEGGAGGPGGDGGDGGDGGAGKKCGLYKRGSSPPGPSGANGSQGSNGKKGFLYVKEIDHFDGFRTNY
jgi:hypothetical protein